MEVSKFEVLSELSCHHAHWCCVLAYDTKGVVVYVVIQQGISERCCKFPFRNGQRSLDLGLGYLAEVVVPFVMVCVYVLFVVVRLSETSLKMALECQWALAVSSERIEVSSDVSINSEVIDFCSCECVVSSCVPCEVVLVLTLRTCVEIDGILNNILWTCQIAGWTEAVVFIWGSFRR